MRITMAPYLSEAQHLFIRDMILSNTLKQVEIAKVAECSTRSIRTIALKLQRFGKTRSPPNRAGRRRRVTPQMIDALRERLLEKPGLYQDEMAVFLFDEFNVLVTPSSISRALKSIGWSKKTARQVAKQRNPHLRDYYSYSISPFHSHHFIFVDESGLDKRAGFRRTGWSPLGATPVQVARFHRDRRYQILPAYTQDGVLLSRVFQGTTDSNFFEDYIEELLQHCNPYPMPRSVLVMDNASIHRSPKIKEMCSAAGVKLIYLPPYSPDLNPIEEFFAELKAFIKRQWHEYEDKPNQDFKVFLEWCVSVVGGREHSAKAHFRHAGITIDSG
jgi:transposase